MHTTIRTAKARYTVTGIECPATGPARLIVRQASGKRRFITRTEVGTTRFNGAVAHYLAAQAKRRALGLAA
jgi:hypothetical protein